MGVCGQIHVILGGPPWHGKVWEPRIWKKYLEDRIGVKIFIFTFFYLFIYLFIYYYFLIQSESNGCNRADVMWEEFTLTWSKTISRRCKKSRWWLNLEKKPHPPANQGKGFSLKSIVIYITVRHHYRTLASQIKTIHNPRGKRYQTQASETIPKIPLLLRFLLMLFNLIFQPCCLLGITNCPQSFA